jgi:hypothetical protein
MQIRELSLKELYDVYEVLSQLRDIEYDTFENLIYDMRDMHYTMIGIIDNEKLISFAGVAIQTTFKNGRHLMVFDFITSGSYDKEKYDKIMKEYLDDYAKMSMCDKVIYDEHG